MKLYEICFSPTGGTKKVADLLSDELSKELLPVDLTDYTVDFSSLLLSEEDLAVIAVPSYGGRVPAVALQRLSKIRGNDALAVLVCVYGNRAYEDTLTELMDAAGQAGFHIAAAIAAIAEHSIARQFAAGRPDSHDHQQLISFARQIRQKLDSGLRNVPVVPGNHPYKKSGGTGMVPKPTKACVKCGLCAAKCPVQAIDKEDPGKVDSHVCISCMRCISICPHQARKLNPIMLAAANGMLKKVCADRKECELFL